MEKAKLTKAQAEALKFVLGIHIRATIVELQTDPIFVWEDEEEKPLNSICLEDLCLALYVGYEVIEEDQVVTVTEQTRKDILELFDSPSGGKMFEEGFLLGVTRVLQLTGIKVRGLND